MQERLIELRYLNGVADGVFGTETQAALIAFQQNNGLTADGVAGVSTLNKLNGSCRAATGVSATAKPSGTVVLREGDSGENVYNLQARLFELGYYSGRIDGRFTSETTQAVKAFQQANGLTADGIAGSGTQNKLNSGNAVVSQSGTVAETEENTGSGSSTGTLSTLRYGDRSDEVRVLQQYLSDLGYLSTSPDGQFGSGTERAVKLFQEANGLTADGIAGMGTLSILYGGDAVEYANTLAGRLRQYRHACADPGSPNMDIVIQWESEGEDVRQYQERLVELGYLESRNVTGKFNQPTVDATKAFQTMNDLKVDGAAGPESLKRIYSDDALNADGVRIGDMQGSTSVTMVADVLSAGMSANRCAKCRAVWPRWTICPPLLSAGCMTHRPSRRCASFSRRMG